MKCMYQNIALTEQLGACSMSADHAKSAFSLFSRELIIYTHASGVSIIKGDNGEI